MSDMHDLSKDGQSDDEVSASEIIGYVYRFAIYAIEDGLDDFKEDVMDNQGWTEAQANRGHEVLKRLIVSLQSQADVLKAMLEDVEE